jgi:hypothetical protein
VACLDGLVRFLRSSTVGSTDWVVFLTPEGFYRAPNAMLDDYACTGLPGLFVGEALLYRVEIVGEGIGSGRVQEFEFGVEESGVEGGNAVRVRVHWSFKSVATSYVCGCNRAEA